MGEHIINPVDAEKNKGGVPNGQMDILRLNNVLDGLVWVRYFCVLICGCYQIILYKMSKNVFCF